MPRLLPARWVRALRPEHAEALELPREVLGDFRRRVRVAAVLGVAAYGVFLAFEWTRVPQGPTLERRVDLIHDGLGLALCAGLWLAARARSIDDRAALALALAAEVSLCALISLAIPLAAYLRTGYLSPLTWVVPIIILFPLLVPSTPRSTVVVSGLCALMMPLGPWLLSATHRIVASPADIAASAVSGAVAAGIAVAAARVIHGASAQVAATRAAGSYELLEPLARGGMGEVWRARHLLLARPSAVKLISPEALQGPRESRDTAVERFTREAQITASLKSPHTVELFDFGVGLDGALYYAMELLEGANLEHFVYQFGPIEPRRAVHWLRQACHSLGEAHARGLVHRDIKPSNIVLCRHGRDVDFIKLVDFGLSRPVRAEDESPQVTRAGARPGTPGYMAPEQIFGLEADSRADLYALGCVGYWLVAGVRPFEADSPGELMRRHVQEPPPSLSERGRPRVPERFERAILSCLAKQPEDRPRDADQLADLLVASIDGEPWSEADARAWWETNLPAR